MAREISKKLLFDDVEKQLKKRLLDKASQLGVLIVQMEAPPFHVHVFVKTSPSVSPADTVRSLIGYTLRRLRRLFPALMKIPLLVDPFLFPRERRTYFGRNHPAI
jgi:putative transposase